VIPLIKLQQTIIPAISDFKSLRLFTKTDIKTCVLMGFQLAELHHVIEELHQNNKEVILHIDLIKGLSSDEFGAIHAIQNIGVDGIISIKPGIIQVAKKRHVLAILRIFLKDSMSLQKSIEVISHTNPDFVEILPAIGGTILESIQKQVNVDIICGGLISTGEQINDCLSSGAKAVTVSDYHLWN
jgi:glycerol uptake operon antiterminator